MAWPPLLLPMPPPLTHSLIQSRRPKEGGLHTGNAGIAWQDETEQHQRLRNMNVQRVGVVVWRALQPDWLPTSPLQVWDRNSRGSKSQTQVIQVQILQTIENILFFLSLPCIAIFQHQKQWNGEAEQER